MRCGRTPMRSAPARRQAAASDAVSAAERLERWRKISSRHAAPRPGRSSSGCWRPRKRRRLCKSACAPSARAHNRPAPSGHSRSLRSRLDRLAPREGPLRQAAENMTAARPRGPWRVVRRLENRARRRAELFLVPPTNLHRNAGRGDRCASGKDPGDGARKYPGRAQRAGSSAIQEPGRRLLSGAFAGLEVRKRRDLGSNSIQPAW